MSAGLRPCSYIRRVTRTSSVPSMVISLLEQNLDGGVVPGRPLRRPEEGDFLVACRGGLFTGPGLPGCFLDGHFPSRCQLVHRIEIVPELPVSLDGRELSRKEAKD